MQNVMMIDNIAYAVFEVPGPVFVLKSDVISAFENKEGKVVTSAPLHESMKFRDKFYGYYQIKQKPENNDEIIPIALEVHSEKSSSDLANNCRG